jgi:unsaturated chondroitin disaccharide hydrolase
MFKKVLIACSCFIMTIYSFGQDKNNLQENISTVFNTAAEQYKTLLDSANVQMKYPRSSKNGNLTFVGIEDWTGGFWPGALWYMFEYTKNPKWKEAAIKWTETLESNQFNTKHHDIGFMMYNSYGNGYRLTKNEKYKAILIQSAKSLCKRYNEKVGAIKSWNDKPSLDGKDTMRFPVIIDNMMNLELLFFASKITGDPTYKNIAIKHAEKTMQNHVRPDFSSYHVVDYDTITGIALHKETNQGYAHNSTWTRGEAWGIYGFTMTYRETGDIRFLNTAINMADFFINHKNLPSDKIPNWDFNVNEVGYTSPANAQSNQLTYIPKDASAAAILASALLELSNYTGTKGAQYKKTANEILSSLSSKNYLAVAGTNNGFLLMHCTGNANRLSEVDKPIMYGDYYFLEALLRTNK